MAIILKKTPSIYDIFEKDNSKNYTKNAILRQDIISYYNEVLGKENRDNSFTFWKLASWLVNNNLEFVTRYQGRRVRDSYIINNTRKRILIHIEELMCLRLIKRTHIGKAKKVDIEIDIYEYTRGGQLLAWFIKSLDPKQQLNANSQIYDVAVKAFNTQDDSSSIAISKFLIKCKEKGLFDKLVEHIQKIIHLDLSPKLGGVVDLFSYIFNSSFDGSNVKSELLGVWSETIQQLEPETRKLMVYQLKLHVERKFANRQEFVSRQYEELCFKLKGDHEKIALEGACLSCEYRGSLELHYTEYLKIIASTIMVALCPRCGTQNLLVSNL